jgi:hypothetical protein
MKQRATQILAAATLTVAVALAGGACGGDDDTGEPAATTTSAGTPEPVIDVGDGGNYAPELRPEDFVATVDNPYFPLRPGDRWVYEGRDGEDVERIEVVVTRKFKEVLGIRAVVVRDTVTIDGELAEDTYDWYAQDKDGNVWYLGEDTKEYENGKVVSTEGSWEAGVDGAYAGIIMQADPQVGTAYRQEYYPGQAEDLAEIIDVGASASVRAGDFDDVVVIREWNPLEPDVVEEKSYAPGIGVVLEHKTAGGEGRIELLSTPAG